MQKPSSLSHAIFEHGLVPSTEEIKRAIKESIAVTLDQAKKPGLLLSAGVDSSYMLYNLLQHESIPTFTIAGSHDHPDLLAAQKLAGEWGVEHHILVPASEDVERAKTIISAREAFYPGDEGVYLACEFAAHYEVKTLIATDGIDELMGGYWWHANRSDRFPTIEGAFSYFWKVLYPEHLEPLLRSAEECGLEVVFPYLNDKVVSLLVRVPLDHRVSPGKPKAMWKAIVAEYIPAWIIERPKLGFVSALTWE